MANDPVPAKEEAGDRHDDNVRNVPLSLTGPGVVLPGTLEPLTPKQKAARALKNTIGARAIGNRMLLAGINQWSDHPHEWEQGMEGYGKRFASRFGRLAVRRALELSTDIIFKIDSRYDRCLCEGFLARSGHAWRRVFVARKDNGTEMINATQLTAAYVTPIITDQWYPSRLNTWEHKLSSGSQYLMWRGLTNTIREFWPEISRKIPIGKGLYR
jgi:hypothetical protein